MASERPTPPPAVKAYPLEYAQQLDMLVHNVKDVLWRWKSGQTTHEAAIRSIHEWVQESKL